MGRPRQHQRQGAVCWTMAAQLQQRWQRHAIPTSRAAAATWTQRAYQAFSIRHPERAGAVSAPGKRCGSAVTCLRLLSGDPKPPGRTAPPRVSSNRAADALEPGDRNAGARAETAPGEKLLPCDLQQANTNQRHYHAAQSAAPPSTCRAWFAERPHLTEPWRSRLGAVGWTMQAQSN